MWGTKAFLLSHPTHHCEIWVCWWDDDMPLDSTIINSYNRIWRNAREHIFHGQGGKRQQKVNISSNRPRVFLCVGCDVAEVEARSSCMHSKQVHRTQRSSQQVWRRACRDHSHGHWAKRRTCWKISFVISASTVPAPGLYTVLSSLGVCMFGNTSELVCRREAFCS